MHVTLPHIEQLTPAELREGRGSSIINRNHAIKECAERIRRAGGTVSHEIPVREIVLEDGLRVVTARCPELGTASRIESNKARLDSLTQKLSCVPTVTRS